jgi:DNA-binding CsgD family transcriptional regulator
MQAPFADPSPIQRKTLLPLAGRQLENYFLHSFLDTVENDQPGMPRALTVSGEMGVGKTRLLTALQLSARQRGFLVLESRAYEASTQFPYFPFIEALRPTLRNVEQLLTGQYLRSEHAPQESLTPAQQEQRLHDAFATQLEELAREQPVLLCIDNIQWADISSLQLMLYLTMRLHHSRVALVGATRPRPSGDEMNNGLARHMLIQLVSDQLLAFLPLGPLSEEAASEHLHTLLPGAIEAGLKPALLERAEGNPFFLEELVRSLTLSQRLVLQDGIWMLKRTGSLKLPESIVRAVELRLQDLSIDCRETLQTAALFGRTFPGTALAEVLQIDDETLQDRLTEAQQCSLIAPLDTESGESGPLSFRQEILSYQFCQGIVQEVFQAAVASQRRSQLHAAIGKALEECYGTHAHEHAAELARHYTLGGVEQATLRWSLLAGEEALQKQAPREALSHFRRALKLLTAQDQSDLPLAELLITIGDLWTRVGDLDQAIRSFQQALEHLQRLPEPPPLLQARANRQLSDAYRLQNRYELALAHLQRASAALEHVSQSREPAAATTVQVPWLPRRSFSLLSTTTYSSSSEQLLALQLRAMLLLFLNQPDEAEQVWWQTHQLATDCGDRNGQAHAMQMIGWTLSWGQRTTEAIRLITAANQLYGEIGDPLRMARGEQTLGSMYLALGDISHARQYTAQGLERAHRYPMPGMPGLLRWNLGTLALMQGEWQSSANLFQQTLQEGQGIDNNLLKTLALQGLAVLRFKEGNWPEADKLFQEAIPTSSDTEWQISTLALYGHFLSVTGRKTLALARLDAVADLPNPPGFGGNFYVPFLVEAYLQLDKLDRVRQYKKILRNLRGLIFYGTSVDRILGKIAATYEDWEAAEQAFEEGLMLCQRCNNQPEEGTIYYEQAQMALKRARPVKEINHLCEQASTIFQRYQMQRALRLVEDLRKGAAELEARHAPKQTGSYRQFEQLTKRELEVLCLVSKGHQDREVADILVISPRTVHRHMSNIFVKLDVPGRVAAVAYAIQHGLV